MKDYFEVFLSVPPHLVLKSSYMLFAHLVNVLSICTRLSLLECDGWDLIQVRAFLDCSEYLDRLLCRFDEWNRVAKEPGLNRNTDNILDRGSVKIRRLKAWFDVRKTMGSAANSTEFDTGLWKLDSTMQFMDLDYVPESFWMEDLLM